MTAPKKKTRASLALGSKKDHLGKVAPVGTAGAGGTVGSNGAAVAPHDRFAALPAALRAHRCWLVWRYGEPNATTGKRGKVPHYPSGRKRWGPQGEPGGDLDRLGTFDQALTAFAAGSWEGIGFATLDTVDVTAIDFDNKEDALSLAEVTVLCADTYVERSPSGKGYHAFYIGKLEKRPNGARGIEIFSHKQFVTVTGDRIAGHPKELAPLSHATATELLRLSTRSAVLRRDGRSMKKRLDLSVTDVRDILKNIPIDATDSYHPWLRKGMALHHQFEGAAEGLALWREISYAPDECDEKYAGFGSYEGDEVTMFTMVREAEASGYRTPLTVARAIADFRPVAKDDGIQFELESATDYMKNHKRVLRPPVLGVACPVGVTVIAGEGGTGKTTILATWAAHITSGRPCIPWEAHTVQRAAAGVLWLTVEEDLHDMVIPRHIAEKMGGNGDLLFRPKIERKKNADGEWVARDFDIERDLQGLLQRSTIPIGLIVCDSLPGLVQWGRRTPSSDTDVKALISRLDVIVHDYGAALVGVAHWNKKADLPEQNRVSGSTAWVNQPRLSYTCVRGYIYTNKGNDMSPMGCTFAQEVVEKLRVIEIETDDPELQETTARRAVFGAKMLRKEAVLELRKVAEAVAAEAQKDAKRSRHDKMCDVVREQIEVFGLPLPVVSVWNDVQKKLGIGEPSGAEKKKVHDALKLESRAFRGQSHWLFPV